MIQIKKLLKWKTTHSRADATCLVAACLTDLRVSWSFERSRATNSHTASLTSIVKTSTYMSRKLTTTKRCFLKTFVTISSLTGRGRLLTTSSLAMASKSHVHRSLLLSRSKIHLRVKKTKRPCWGSSWSIKMDACGPTISLSYPRNFLTKYRTVMVSVSKKLSMKRPKQSARLRRMRKMTSIWAERCGSSFARSAPSIRCLRTSRPITSSRWWEYVT